MRCRYPGRTNRGIPAQGARMTVIFSESSPLPWWNQPGDSRARRENDSNIFRVVAVSPAEPTVGFFGRLRLPLNDVQESESAAGCGAAWTREAERCALARTRSTVDAERPNPPSFRGVRQHPVESHTEGQRLKPWTREGRPLFRHPREAGIPHAGAEQYNIVTPQQPSGGFPRKARE